MDSNKKVVVLIYIQYINLFSERVYVTGFQEHSFFSNSSIISCDGNTSIKIIDLLVKQHTTSCPETNNCNLTEAQTNSIMRHCNKGRICVISKHISNSCLFNDYGRVSISYSCTGHSNSSCTFENEGLPVHCDWYRRGSSVYKWKLRKGKTPSYFTGPDSDHTTSSANGVYAYTESLDSSAFNDESSLMSGVIEPSTNQCLSFWYHMYGRDINTLKVFQSNREHNIELWKKSGNQGDKWYFQSLPLKHIGPYQIIFKAIRGHGDKSDIAVDDIFINNTACNSGLTDYTESCRKMNEPIPLYGCSEYYLKLDKARLTFDQELDNCSAVYQNMQASLSTLCNHMNNSDICTLDMSEKVQKDSGCFLSNSLLIEYKCEDNKMIHTSWRGSFRETKKNQKNGFHTNNSADIQNASLANINSDIINLNSQLTTTQINHCDNVYANTEFKDDIIEPDCEYSNIANTNSVIHEKGTAVSKYRTYQGDVPSYNISSKHDDNDVEDLTNKTNFNKGPIHQTDSTKSNMVIEPQENIFEGSEFYNLTKPTCSNVENYQLNSENNDVYCSSEEETYNFAGCDCHKEAERNIYSHTVDDVYDSTTHKRHDDDGEDKYDHFLGQLTEDVYDTSN